MVVVCVSGFALLLILARVAGAKKEGRRWTGLDWTGNHQMEVQPRGADGEKVTFTVLVTGANR